MNDGHLITLLGAIVLLSILVLNVNRTILSATDHKLQAETIIACTSVGQHVIDLISSKKFDEAAISEEITDVTAFTPAASLGPEYGENYNYFDDVDDYNNYSGVVATPRMGNCSVNISVNYVNQEQPDIISQVQTCTKRIEAKVYNVILPDTLRLYYYSSY